MVWSGEYKNLPAIEEIEVCWYIPAPAWLRLRSWFIDLLWHILIAIVESLLFICFECPYPLPFCVNPVFNLSLGFPRFFVLGILEQFGEARQVF